MSERESTLLCDDQSAETSDHREEEVSRVTEDISTHTHNRSKNRDKFQWLEASLLHRGHQEDN